MTATSSAADLDAAIVGYLPLLDQDQKAAILSVIEAFAPAPDTGDHWEDPTFVAEMDRRYEDYKSGRVKMNTLEEFIAAGREVINEVRNKKPGE